MTLRDRIGFDAGSRELEQAPDWAARHAYHYLDFNADRQFSFVMEAKSRLGRAGVEQQLRARIAVDLSLDDDALPGRIRDRRAAGALRRSERRRRAGLARRRTGDRCDRRRGCLVRKAERYRARAILRRNVVDSLDVVRVARTSV
jgi:hypothetical protein